MKPLVTCQHCKGKGKVGISDALLAAMAALRAGPATPPEIFRRLVKAGLESVSFGSANNSLEKLRGLKMVTRKKEAGVRGYIYSIAPKAK